jgi:hypothetical protein
MSTENKHRICPVERAGALGIFSRKLLQNPRKILGPHVKDGMTVLDLGCGPLPGPQEKQVKINHMYLLFP